MLLCLLSFLPREAEWPLQSPTRTKSSLRAPSGLEGLGDTVTNTPQAWRVTLLWVTAAKKVCGAGVPLTRDPGKGWLCFQDLKAQKTQFTAWLSTHPSGSLGWVSWSPFVLLQVRGLSLELCQPTLTRG